MNLFRSEEHARRWPAFQVWPSIERGADLVDDALAVGRQLRLAALEQHAVDDGHRDTGIRSLEGDVLRLDLRAQRAHELVIGRRELGPRQQLSPLSRIELLLERGGSLARGGQLAGQRIPVRRDSAQLVTELAQGGVARRERRAMLGLPPLAVYARQIQRRFG